MGINKKILLHKLEEEIEVWESLQKNWLFTDDVGLTGMISGLQIALEIVSNLEEKKGE